MCSAIFKISITCKYFYLFLIFIFLVYCTCNLIVSMFYVYKFHSKFLESLVNGMTLFKVSNFNRTIEASEIT